MGNNESPRDRCIRALKELSARKVPPQAKFGRFYSAYQIGQRAHVTPGLVHQFMDELLEKPGYSSIVLPGNNVGYRFDNPFRLVGPDEDD